MIKLISLGLQVFIINKTSQIINIMFDSDKADETLSNTLIVT
ncbi:hypothetical protein [Clostridium fungisolvens]|nr:hypothetical protein [Clostridium fungisolvens]